MNQSGDALSEGLPQRIRAALTPRGGGGLATYKATSLGLWGCSDLDAALDVFGQVGLDKYKHFADLGCGDGRVVLAASAFTQATGVEIDKGLVESGRRAARRLGLDRARFVRKDCRELDLSSFDFLYIYPDKPLGWLEDSLPAGWMGSLMIYGPRFFPEHMQHAGSFYSGDAMCTMWRKT